jgi:hypothetical protein
MRKEKKGEDEKNEARREVDSLLLFLRINRACLLGFYRDQLAHLSCFTNGLIPKQTKASLRKKQTRKIKNLTDYSPRLKYR